MPVTPAPVIDAALLFKLRVAVGRFGEMGMSGWWGTNGVLGTIGRAALSRGFPATHSFAQSRIVCTVAATRCREVYNAADSLTLWNLPPQIEEAIDSSWQAWCRDPSSWTSFFERVASMKANDLCQELAQLGLIDDSVVSAVGKLKIAAHAKSIEVVGATGLDNHAIRLLAAGFSRGAKGALVVPFLKSR